MGQFNDVVADYAVRTLAALPGKPLVRAVGERVYALWSTSRLWSGRFKIESDGHRAGTEYASVYVIHNRPQSEALYEPVAQRLLPFGCGLATGFGRGPVTDAEFARGHA